MYIFVSLIGKIVRPGADGFVNGAVPIYWKLDVVPSHLPA
jgi:hypothetical protein